MTELNEAVKRDAIDKALNEFANAHRQYGLHHLAYNCIVSGVEDASRLDGWSDLERGMMTMSVEGVQP